MLESSTHISTHPAHILWEIRRVSDIIFSIVQGQEFWSAAFPNERFKKSGIEGLYLLTEDLSWKWLFDSMQYSAKQKRSRGIDFSLWRTFWTYTLYKNAKITWIHIDSSSIKPHIKAGWYFDHDWSMPNGVNPLRFPEYISVLEQTQQALEKFRALLV